LKHAEQQLLSHAPQTWPPTREATVLCRTKQQLNICAERSNEETRALCTWLLILTDHTAPPLPANLYHLVILHQHRYGSLAVGETQHAL